jgi:hypothetical protein
LDPGVIDYILGKPDAVLMKEALASAVDDNLQEEDRVVALDNLELLVENLDNANDLEKLQLWKPLQDLLTSPSSTDSIKRQTLWVIGTAVQNNPAAQSSYLSLAPLPTILSFLTPLGNSPQTRSKAVYALSGVLKHNAAAVQAFDAADGWTGFRLALEDSDITVRRKTVFLLNTLLIPDIPDTPADTNGNLHTRSSQPAAPVHPNSHASMLSDPSSKRTSTATLKALREHRLLAALISALTAPTPHGSDGESEGDIDFEEKIVRLLHTYAASCQGQFSDEEQRKLHKYFDDERRTIGENVNLGEIWGLSAVEMKSLSLAVS